MALASIRDSKTERWLWLNVKFWNKLSCLKFWVYCQSERKELNSQSSHLFFPFGERLFKLYFLNSWCSKIQSVCVKMITQIFVCCYHDIKPYKYFSYSEFLNISFYTMLYHFLFPFFLEFFIVFQCYLLKEFLNLISCNYYSLI